MIMCPDRIFPPRRALPWNRQGFRTWYLGIITRQEIAIRQEFAMVRRLGLLVVAMSLAVGASAAVNPGVISGYVRNSAGTPQMGATVQVLSLGAPLTATTDASGHYA